MSKSHDGKTEDRLKTVDVERRMYGRRYTGLPVDSIDNQGLRIDCTDTYMRPAMFDLQTGDTVRWLNNGRYVQGSIHRVERTDTTLHAELEDIITLPPDFFAS